MPCKRPSWLIQGECGSRYCLDRLAHVHSFVPTADLLRSCERRHIPRDILLLLAKLVDVVPEARPSAEKVKMALRKLVSAKYGISARV
jgi:hypothetical protein